MAFNFGTGGTGGGDNKAPAFSFGGDSKAPTSAGFSFGGTGAADPKKPGTGGFSFGGDASKTPTFGATPAPSAAGGGGLSFGGAGKSDVTKAPAPGGFSLSGGGTAGAAGGGFSFGSTATSGITAPAPAPPAASFGATAKSPTPSFGATGKSPAPGGFSFGGAPANKAAATPAPAPGGFSFGGAAPADKPAAAPAPAGGFSFGGGAASKDKAPTPGGFSLGGSAPVDSKINSFASPTPAAGGFSFGGGAADKAPAPPAPTGGFSFGAKAADSAAPGAGAPPAAGGFSVATKPAENSGAAAPSFGQTTPAKTAPPATPATPGAPAPVATPVTTKEKPKSAPEPPKLEYQTLSVEQIINKFQKELEKDALAFMEEARQVAEYDAILRDSQRDIAKLTQQAHKTLLEQQDVEQMLNGIDAFQREIESTLDTVEQHVGELFQAQAGQMPVDADVEREKAYTTAGQLEQRLQVLSDSLNGVLEEMEATQERVLTGDAGKIVKILNQHEKSLADLENAGRRIELDVGHVNRMLERR